MIKYRQKVYTRYDMTDRLKQMRDSDILAEKEKEKMSEREATGGVSVGKAALGGAAIAGVASGLNNYMKGAKLGFGKRAAVKGALLGTGLSMGYNALRGMTTSKEKRQEVQRYNEDVDFYNKRLREAQKQAKRREAVDWKNNMTNREGYTY
jgi:hypothetical protein